MTSRFAIADEQTTELAFELIRIELRLRTATINRLRLLAEHRQVRYQLLQIVRSL